MTRKVTLRPRNDRGRARARAIVGGLRRISMATASRPSRRIAALLYTTASLPFFPPIALRILTRVKNTRLTIRRLPRSCVMLANYPASNSLTLGVSHGRGMGISGSQGCNCRNALLLRYYYTTIAIFIAVRSGRGCRVAANSLICKLMTVLVAAGGIGENYTTALTLIVRLSR